MLYSLAARAYSARTRSKWVYHIPTQRQPTLLLWPVQTPKRKNTKTNPHYTQKPPKHTTTHTLAFKPIPVSPSTPRPSLAQLHLEGRNPPAFERKPLRGSKTGEPLTVYYWTNSDTARDLYGDVLPHPSSGGHRVAMLHVKSSKDGDTTQLQLHTNTFELGFINSYLNKRENFVPKSRLQKAVSTL